MKGYFLCPLWNQVFLTTITIPTYNLSFTSFRVSLVEKLHNKYHSKSGTQPFHGIVVVELRERVIEIVQYTPSYQIYGLSL